MMVNITNIGKIGSPLRPPFLKFTQEIGAPNGHPDHRCTQEGDRGQPEFYNYPPPWIFFNFQNLKESSFYLSIH